MPIKLAFERAIRETIRLGGDTDTNACIVGAMMGAAIGLENIPKLFVQKVVTLDAAVDPWMADKTVRPSFLSVQRHVLPNIKKLIEKRPIATSSTSSIIDIQWIGKN